MVQHNIIVDPEFDPINHQFGNFLPSLLPRNSYRPNPPIQYSILYYLKANSAKHIHWRDACKTSTSHYIIDFRII